MLETAVVSICTMEYSHESSSSSTMRCATRKLQLWQKLVSALWIILAVLAPGVFSSDCSIVTRYKLKEAGCENRGFQTVPQDLIHDIKVFKLADNQITYLEIDTFKDYKSLQQIFLARNEIDRIAPDAFRHLANLQTLDLSYNKLKVVPSHAFKHLHSVRSLVMKSNPIRYVTGDAFGSLPKIEKLDFENCWLERIDPHAFLGLQHLKEINVVNNYLHTLSAEMEQSLPQSLHIFRIHSNSWNCDCKLRWLLEWLTRTKKVNWDFYSNTPKCGAPAMIKDVNWVDLEPNRFACASDIIINTTSFDLIVGTNITIVCEVNGDPPPEVTWEKGTQEIDEFTDPRKYRLHIKTDKHKLWSKLTIFSVRLSDAGEYKCTAKNLAGQSAVTYVLREKPATPPPPKQTTTKGVNTGMIIAIIVGGCCVVVFIMVCVGYIICRNYRNRHAYNVRNYQKSPKNKQPKKEKPQFDDEEQAIIKENDKRATSAATQLLEKKKKEQEKELVKEFYKGTDIAEAPILCNDVHENTNTAKKDAKEFKMRIFASYEDEARNRRSAELQSTSPETEVPGVAIVDKRPKPKANCNNIQEVTPDLLKTQEQQMVPNHRPTQPNHVQGSNQKRAAENPYAKPSDLRPGALPRKQSRSAENLLDSSGDGSDSDRVKGRSNTLGPPHSPSLRNNHVSEGRHDTSPCSNPICFKDQEPGAKSATNTPKPHIKTSQSMGGIQGRAADDSSIDVTSTSRGQSAGKGGDRYATLPSKPRQGILHNGNPSRTMTYGVRFPDDTPGSPSSSPSKSPTYHCQRPFKGPQVHQHGSPTRTPIPKYHPQIIRGTTATGNRLPSKQGSLVTSPSGSETSGEFSPRKPARTFASTSLDDILSPPFGSGANGSEKPKGTKKSQKLPKPGEKDEFGTAV